MSLNKFTFLSSYNPWWEEGGAPFAGLPRFRRDVFADLYDDVNNLPQMISVTGPRRVGKSTLLRQSIEQLIADAGENGHAQARRIAYFSMDDPGLSLPGFDADKFFNEFVTEAAKLASAGTVYLFLDEIQRFPRWELYLKKFYDLKVPVRIVVSGSASTPIFKKSRESLLGRIKDYHVLPFSYREWSVINVIDLRVAETTRAEASSALAQWGNVIRNAGEKSDHGTVSWELLSDVVTMFGLDRQFPRIADFFYEGGFPEVWALPTQFAKQNYLYQNQIERVIFEDLLVAAEFRKPEMLRRFYLGLLVDPGRETNLARVSSEIALDRRTIESYFPLLEATDLVWRLHKFTGSKATAKAGNFKTYLVDMAVRNAVMKLSQEQLVADDTLMGKYAENVVANHLRRWPGLVELAYYRKGNDELDFIVDLGAARVGVEVKYRNQIDEKSLWRSAVVAKELKCEGLILVTKDVLTPAQITQTGARLGLPFAAVPLAAFLMLF